MTENGDLAKSFGATLGVPLKEAGFRKRGNSFNRSVADGLVHLVSVQVGPAFAPDLHGKFTVNLGVFVPEMTRMGAPRSTWINDYNCQLRWRLGDLTQGDPETWWDLRDRLALDEVTVALFDLGLPKLDSFPDAASVLDAYAREGHAAFGPIAPRSTALDVADLLLAQGDFTGARNLLAKYVPEIASGDHEGHKEYFRRYLAERNLSDLDDPLA